MKTLLFFEGLLFLIINVLLFIEVFSHQRIIDIWLCIVTSLLVMFVAFTLIWFRPKKDDKNPVIDKGTKYWFNKNGRYHREDGPAIEWDNGGKCWYLNGKRHRIDGPAIEWARGSKAWYKDGKLHRVEGTAVETAWYLYGKELSEELFLQLTGDIKNLPLYLGLGFDDFISERLLKKQ